MKEKVVYGLIGIAILGVLFFGGLFLAKGMTSPEASKDNQGHNSTPRYNDQTAQFIHKEPKEVLQLLSEEQPGIYYFGFPTCPWCLELLPILDSVLADQHQKAMAVNIRSEDYTSAEKEKLTAFFLKHTSQSEVAVPFVVKITTEGQVKTHIGTVAEHDATKGKMIDQQVSTLRSELTDLLK